jgi:hypothetical protein
VVPDAVIQRVLKNGRDYSVAWKQPLFSYPARLRDLSASEGEEMDKPEQSASDEGKKAAPKKSHSLGTHSSTSPSDCLYSRLVTDCFCGPDMPARLRQLYEDKAWTKLDSLHQGLSPCVHCLNRSYT